MFYSVVGRVWALEHLRSQRHLPHRDPVFLASSLRAQNSVWDTEDSWYMCVVLERGRATSPLSRLL